MRAATNISFVAAAPKTKNINCVYGTFTYIYIDIHIYIYIYIYIYIFNVAASAGTIILASSALAASDGNKERRKQAYMIAN